MTSQSSAANSNPIKLSDLAKDNLDINSVKTIIGDVKQVMVYGWWFCHYKEVSEALRNNGHKVFDYTVGKANATNATTLEGYKIEKLFPEKPESTTHRSCKNGLTNLLLDNYKRVEQGLDIIPVIFCVDADDNEEPSNAETMSSKTLKNNKYITNSELRRCYKLYKELENSPDQELQKMAQIAKKMFKFVKVSKEGNQAVLKKVPALWEQPDVSEALDKRALVTREKALEERRLKTEEIQAKFRKADGAKLGAQMRYNELQELTRKNQRICNKLSEKISKATTPKDRKEAQKALKEAKKVVTESLKNENEAHKELLQIEETIKNIESEASEFKPRRWTLDLLKAARAFDSIKTQPSISDTNKDIFEDL